MNSKRSKVFASALAVLASTLIMTAPVSAGGHHRHGGFGQDLFRMERLADDLDLTEAQRTEFQRLSDQGREQARPYVKIMVEQHKAMRELMHDETFDEAAVRALAARGNAAMTELAVIRARNVFEFRKILTPEQRQQMSDQHGHGQHGHDQHEE